MTATSHRAAGPWVLVVGMHRSTTSAITGMLAGLGLALPPTSDLVEGNADNPVHYESRALIALGDRLLSALDGWWDNPPSFNPGWQDDRRVATFDDEALATLARIYNTSGPKVWKDPRLCLLLPYWLRLLDEPAPAVFVWRAPAGVADSLRRRDGSTFSHGLALWSAYNRAALDALAGRPVYVVESRHLLDHPTTTAATLAGWLDAQGIRAPGPGGWDIGRAGAVVDPDLVRSDLPDMEVPAEFAAMVVHLESLAGAHVSFDPVDLGADPPWVVDVLDGHRQADNLRRRLVESEQTIIALHADHRNLDAKIVALDDAGRRLALELAATREELGREQSAVSRLQSIGTELDQELNAVRTHAERVELELERIRASASWRLTAPLRWRGGRSGGGREQDR